MRLRRIAFALMLASVLAIIAAILNNDVAAPFSSRAQFAGTLDRALAASRDWILAQGTETATTLLLTSEGRLLALNPVLVHMVDACARLSGDQRLRKFSTFALREAKGPNSQCWARLLDPPLAFMQPSEDYARNQEEYNHWFLHALAPTEFALGREEQADMFSATKFRTGRATHQVLALYLFRKFNGSTPELDAVIRNVSDRIAYEAAIDFRVTDLYLQRIALLLAVGRPDLARPRWLERVIDAQQPDGGWYFRWHGWDPTPYRFAFEEAPNSHSTVQGMWILYQLKYRYPEWITRNYR